MKRIIMIVAVLGLLVSTAWAIETSPPAGVTSGGTINPGSLTAPAGSAGTIAQYSVNGEVNVASPAYVANPRTSAVASTTATTDGTTANVTLGAADGFVNGEGISIFGANTITSLGASVTPTVTQTGYTGANSGTTVTYAYQISACDATLSCKAASAANVAVNGPAVLSHPNTANGTGAAGTGGNYNVLSGYSVATAKYYVIWRNKAGGGNLLWAVTNLTTFNDWANVQTMSATTGPFTNTPLASDTGGTFTTTILSGAGTTSVVLAAIPPVAGTLTAWPDAAGAIQAAANTLGTNGGKVYMPVGFYKIAHTINPPTRVIFYGAGSARSASAKTILQGSSGVDVFAWNTGAFADMAFRDFGVSGGRNVFFDNSTSAVTNVTMEHLTASSYDFGGIECYKCPMEEWWVTDTFWANGWYGYNLEGDGTGTNYINKAQFTDTQYSTQAVNPIRIFNNGFSNGGVTWLRTNEVGARQDGIYIDGATGIGGIDFNGWNDEGLGVDFGKSVTTATCVSGSDIVAVTSATGLAIGQNFIVLGCGVDADVLEGTICAISSLNITLEDPTCTTAANAGTSQATAQYASNAIFDNFYGAGAGSSFTQVSVENGNFADVGGCCGSNQSRFQIFAKQAISTWNTTFARMEDPFAISPMYPGASTSTQLSSRTAALGGAFTSGIFQTQSLGGPSGMTTITSPKGAPFNIGMVDTVGDGSGTYSPFSIWNSRAAGKIKRFTIDPSGLGTFTAPTVNTTEVAAEPGTSGMAVVSTTAGVRTYLATEAHLGNAGGYGNNTNFPTGNIVMQAVATNAGHFTQLTSTNQSLNAGSCSTAPTFNVFDGASNTGTAKIASAAAQVTRGTATTQVESQTFAAGDVIGIYVSTQGATCLAPTFAVDATVTYP